MVSTGHGLRLPAEIAAGRRGFPAANEIRDLYTSSRARIYESHLINKPYAQKHILCIQEVLSSALLAINTR